MKDMKTLKKIKIVKSAKKLFHRSVAIGENLWLNKSILTTKGTKSAKLYINRKTFFHHEGHEDPEGKQIGH